MFTYVGFGQNKLRAQCVLYNNEGSRHCSYTHIDAVMNAAIFFFQRCCKAVLSLEGGFAVVLPQRSLYNCEPFKAAFPTHCSLYAQPQTADHISFFLGDCSRLFWAVIHIRQLREVTGRHAERRDKASHLFAARYSLHFVSPLYGEKTCSRLPGNLLQECSGKFHFIPSLCERQATVA